MVLSALVFLLVIKPKDNIMKTLTNPEAVQCKLELKSSVKKKSKLAGRVMVKTSKSQIGQREQYRETITKHGKSNVCWKTLLSYFLS